MIVRPAKENTRAKCTQVIIVEGREYSAGELTSFKSPDSRTRKERQIYLHPLSLSRRAYIFPISPRPMMPIEKFDMSSAPVVTFMEAILEIEKGRMYRKELCSSASAFKSRNCHAKIAATHWSRLVASMLFVDVQERIKVKASNFQTR
jgi:hypothetical protein